MTDGRGEAGTQTAVRIAPDGASTGLLGRHSPLRPTGTQTVRNPGPCSVAGNESGPGQPLCGRSPRTSAAWYARIGTHPSDQIGAHDPVRPPLGGTGFELFDFRLISSRNQSTRTSINRALPRSALKNALCLIVFKLE